MQTTLKKITRLIWNRKRDYQKTRQGGTKERWKLIESRITGTSSLLDVGCSSGLITALAAASGLFAIGLDSNWEVLSDARKKCKANLRLTYVEFLGTTTASRSESVRYLFTIQMQP